MPLAGKGMLITSMDVDPADEQDFNLWYDREHLAERVGIEGFLEARRWIAERGADEILLHLFDRPLRGAEQPRLQESAGEPDRLVEETHLALPELRPSGRP